MITKNDRDGRIAAWLQSAASADAIAAATENLGARAWPAKIAKQLGLEVPDSVWADPVDPLESERSAQIKAQHLADLRALRASFKSGV
jgi:hypothetical protein